MNCKPGDLAYIYRVTDKANTWMLGQVCDGMHEEDRPSDYAYSIRARGQKAGA